MQIERPGALHAVELPQPEPAPGQLLVRVHACGVCRTDLHLLDGEVEIPQGSIVPGHQIVGTVIGRGEDASEGGRLQTGTRVGIPWLGRTCGRCRYCLGGRENLCEAARFTGRDIDGGYAEWAVADERYCFALPEGYSDLQVAPLLCAGLIGYRALGMTGDGERLGLYGFGSSAHIVAQVARLQGRRVFAFTRPGDEAGQLSARALGAEWAGDSLTAPPEELDAAIMFASVGELVPVALGALAEGGTLVCAGIHMSDIPSFPYDILWGERTLRSVANLTRQDARAFLALASRIQVRTDVHPYPLSDAGRAPEDLRRTLSGRRGDRPQPVSGRRSRCDAASVLPRSWRFRSVSGLRRAPRVPVGVLASGGRGRGSARADTETPAAVDRCRLSTAGVCG